MARVLRAPMDAMRDLAERNLFYDTWAKALGPESGSEGAEGWLRAFGGQTKWLPTESWTWWLDLHEPSDLVNQNEVLGFLSLLIGLLGQETPSGEAIRYAREMVEYLRWPEEALPDLTVGFDTPI